MSFVVPFSSSSSSSSLSRNALCRHQRFTLNGQKNKELTQSSTRRTLSQESKKSGAQKKAEQQTYGNNPNQTQLQTWTVAKGVKTGVSLTVQLGLAGLVIVCGGLIVKELIPTKMSPNHVFGSAFDRLLRETKIKNYFGSNMKAYGRDRSRGVASSSVEGRRNFVDHVEYDDEQGIHHTRIVFNIEGNGRKGAVYADISKDMDNGDFYYLIVQDRGNPSRKWAIVDNRPQTPYAVRQQEIADHLKKKGVVLYGSNSEPHTVRQLEMFGEACKMLEYVDCNKQPDRCQRAGIQDIPTWAFKEGQMHRGVMDPEDLFTMSTKRSNSVFKNL